MREASRESDESLVERIRRRDTGAHRELFQRYSTRVFAFARRRVDDEMLAEELVADVFFEVWRSVDRFRGDSRVSTWLFGIAHFKTMAALRQRSRGVRGATRPARVEFLHRVPDPVDPSESLEARGQLAEVQRLVQALPASQREVVELCFLEGMPYSEAARRLGVPEATIKTRVSRARARLRRDLGDRLGGGPGAEGRGARGAHGAHGAVWGVAE